MVPCSAKIKTISFGRTIKSLSYGKNNFPRKIPPITIPSEISKFPKGFFVILEDAELSGMNDRFISLLNFFGLEDRIVSNRNDIMPNKSISWNEIDKKMVEYSKGLKEYIDNAIIKV